MNDDKKERQRIANRKYYAKYPERSREASKRWKLNNPEKVNQGKRNYYKSHPEKTKEEVKKYIERNIEKVKVRRRKYYLDHIEKIKEVCKTRYAKHKEAIKSKVKLWAKNNPDKVRANSKLKWARSKKDPMKKLNRHMSYGIWLSLHGTKKHRHWEDLVDYTVDELKIHLEKKFQNGMTWENIGSWHIDHKIPISVHNFTSSDNIDFKKCWALKNLQPLWAKDNLEKWAHIEKPFQPSLAL
jgi:hypothetical protein